MQRLAAEAEYLALHTEAFLRNGTDRLQLPDLLSRIVWSECPDGTTDLRAIREAIVTAVSDFIVLHKKKVNLDDICRKITVTKRNERVSFQLPNEVIAWLQTR